MDRNVTPVPPELEEEEVRVAIRKVKVGRAPGPDALPPELVKVAIGAEIGLFTGMFRELLLQNMFFLNAGKQAR